MKHEKISFKLRLKLFTTILKKDIKSEIRQINDLFSILLFGVISIFIFSSAYNYSTQNQNMDLEIYVIENWFIIFFILIFIMSKLFIHERESGTLGGLITSPVSASTILLSKIVFCFILLIFVEIIIFLFSFIFSAPVIQNLNFIQIIISIILPTIDLSICGGLVSAFSMHTKNKSFVLPILLFPLILPIITPIMSLNINLFSGFITPIFYELIFIMAHITLMVSIIVIISQTLLYD